jgi:alpha-mannosidase
MFANLPMQNQSWISTVNSAHCRAHSIWARFWNNPMLFILLLVFVAVLASPSRLQAQPVRIYLANDDHTDYMWTANAETYNAVFVDMLDYYLRLADETKDNLPPFRSRFNADGSYWLWQYERRKSPAEFERLMARVKDGTMSVPLTTLVSCYGGQPIEAVLRGMYYAGRLERRFHLRFALATAMENQTLPLGLASLWAGSGARYTWRGVCGCASQISNQVLGQRPHEIYWYTGQDGQRVLMKWYSLGPHGIGTYLEASAPEKAIEYLDSNPDFLRRYVDSASGKSYDVRGAFGFGGDALARKTGVPADPGIAKEPGMQQGVIGFPFTEHFHVIAQAHSNDKRQVFVSNVNDFFTDFETNYGINLPSETVTYGNEWDLYSASMAETTARVKRSVEKLRAAELMATLVSLKKAGFLRGREEARDLAFTDLGLYWEHDWTADGPVSREARAAWQELLASEIEYYVNSLHADGAIQLGALIQKPDAKAQRFFVLNSLSWARTQAADFSYAGSQNIHVRDLSTELDVPHQFINLSGMPFLRLLAPDVPPVGYKTFEILPGAGSAPTNLAAVVGTDNATLENSQVKIGLDPDGAIASFILKNHPNADLAQTIGGLKLNDFAPNDTHGSAIIVENSGPVSVTLKCASSAGRPHTTRVTLYRDSDRVEIRNEITENFSDLRHWSFSFNLTSPQVHTEEVGAIICARTKSFGGDYADSHARYDYVTLNHFADVTDGKNTRGVTLANADCSFARLGQSTAACLDTNTPQINVLAGGQVDGSWLGIRGQNGADHFLQRFALSPHAAYDPVAALKFALEQQNPLVAGPVIGITNSPYPATRYSLLNLGDSSTLLWALKPHDDGITNGIVARVWNIGTGPSALRLATAMPLAAAQRVTHIETALEPLPITNHVLATIIPGRCIETYNLMLLGTRPNESVDRR